MCEDGSVSHWINVSLPLTTPLDLVAGRRVAHTPPFLVPFALPFHSISPFSPPKRDPPSFYRDSNANPSRWCISWSKEATSREKMREMEIVPGDFISINRVAKRRHCRIYTAAKSDDLYRIDSGNGGRWDTRVVRDRFWFHRGWLLKTWMDVVEFVRHVKEGFRFFLL